jgi:hypothetical protein
MIRPVRLIRCLLLLVVLLPSAVVAAPCCSQETSTECCGPSGDCPSTPAGDCVLKVVPLPMVQAGCHTLDLPAITRWVPEQMERVTRLAALRRVAGPEFERVQIFLALGALRN